MAALAYLRLCSVDGCYWHRAWQIITNDQAGLNSINRDPGLCSGQCFTQCRRESRTTAVSVLRTARRPSLYRRVLPSHGLHSLRDIAHRTKWWSLQRFAISISVRMISQTSWCGRIILARTAAGEQNRSCDNVSILPFHHDDLNIFSLSNIFPSLLDCDGNLVQCQA